MNLPNQEFGPFSRVNPPLTDPVVVGTAFGLDVGQRSGVLDTKDGLYVIEIAGARPGRFGAVREGAATSSAPSMIDLARQDRVRGYLAALRQAAKIVDNRASCSSVQQQQQQAGPADADQPARPVDRTQTKRARTSVRARLRSGAGVTATAASARPRTRGSGRWRRAGGAQVARLVRAHDRVLGVRQAPLELADPLPDGRADLRQPLGAEQQQHHQQDHHDFGEAEVAHGTP